MSGPRGCLSWRLDRPFVLVVLMAMLPAARGRFCGGQPANVVPNLLWTGMGSAQFSVEESQEVGGDLDQHLEDEALGGRRKLLAAHNLTLGEEGVGEEEEEEGERFAAPRTAASRRLLGLRPGKDGYTPINAGCSGKLARMKHENDVSDPKVKKSVKAGEQPLVDCIKDITKCNEAARRAALELPSLKLINSQSQGLPGMAPGKRFRSCALVGNGGSIRRYKFGPHINAHDVVVRFNLAAIRGHGDFVGNKTTFRMIDHRQSVKVCCLKKYEWLLENDGTGDSPPGVILWFTTAQDEVIAGCKQNFPENPRFGLSIPYVDTLAANLRAMRKDLLRLGFGPFGEWKQLTTGGHAVLLFSRICEKVSLYGFTTYNTNAPDQYTGRKKKAHSGEIWHDWEGEKHSWRLLHAAGKVDICAV